MPITVCLSKYTCTNWKRREERNEEMTNPFERATDTSPLRTTDGQTANPKVWTKLKEFDFLYIASDRCENHRSPTHHLPTRWLRNGFGNEDICSKYTVVLFLSSGKTFLKPTTKNIIACTEFLVSGAWRLYRAFRHQDLVKIFECLNVYLDIVIVKKGFYAMYILYFSYHNDIKEMERNVLLRGDQNRVYNRIKENVWKMHKY